MTVAGATAFNPSVVVFEPPVRRWHCPACTATHTTRDARPHTPMHPCAKFGGMSVPFVPDGTAAKLEAVERQDYIGDEQVQRDADGRPVMSVVTTRDDGQDTTVYAPTAHIRKE